jgi:hypothetical protein
MIADSAQRSDGTKIRESEGGAESRFAPAWACRASDPKTPYSAGLMKGGLAT